MLQISEPNFYFEDMKIEFSFGVYCYYQVEISMNETFNKKESIPAKTPLTRMLYKHYVWSFLMVLATTVIGRLLVPLFDLVNIALIFLLPVLISAVFWGRGPSLFASILGVLCFDFFFVPPVLSFTVSDPSHVFVFVVFLLVSLVTGTLATKLRNELERTRQREKRTLALYALSREIVAETDLQQVLRKTVKTVADSMDGKTIVLLHDRETDVLYEGAAEPPDSALPDEKELAVAHWVLEHGQPAGRGTETVREVGALYFPIKAEDRTMAVLAIKLNKEGGIINAEQQQLIEAYTNLAAVAIIRLQLAKEAEQAKWLAESEKLHTALLNSISHDLRTPLATITGAATSLLTEGSSYNQETRSVLLQTIKEGGQRMNRLVTNLLDMTRLESGILKLNQEWCDIQDVVGVVLREIQEILQERRLQIDIPPDLPFVKADFALMEHVLINLLENAAKYSPPDGSITISARCSNGSLLVTVADHGSAISVPDRGRVFDKFYRAESSKHLSGTGLGLSICKGIIDAHGGQIWVDSSYKHGNRFTFSLPIPEQPVEPSNMGQESNHAV
jgi:two-component system sensor histidine kinase KdpD